jgi:TolA-binding protein
MTVVGLHPEELFDKMLDGALLPAERERLLAHLDSCEVCRFEYAARLDFQEEALALSVSSAPPVLPLRPLLGVEAPLRLPAPRRRRSRTLVWGLAAAALIVASGAVASGLTGKAPWRSVSLLFALQAAPAERAPVAVKPQLGRAAAAVPSAVAAPAADVGAFDAALVVADVVPDVAPVVHAAPAHAQAHEASRPVDATGRKGQNVTAAKPSSADVPSAKDAAPEPATKEPATASKLFGEANQARRSGDVGRASGLYHLLQDQFPGSPEAELSRVTLALLLLDNGDAQGALSGFERYLAGASRGLEAEALVGRARALGRLGRRDLEASAWREVQRKYPQSIYGRQAGERLLALGQP